MQVRRAFLVFAIAVALGGLASACGVKGPLYLPEEPETEKEKDEEEEKTSLSPRAPARPTHV